LQQTLTQKHKGAKKIPPKDRDLQVASTCAGAGCEELGKPDSVSSGNRRELRPRLPDDASLDAIAERLEFLAAIRKGLNQIERGETVSHAEVKRQRATWLTEI